MEQKKKKVITALLCLLDAGEGFEAFAEIPYLALIRPVVRRDRESGLSLKKLSIRYQISVGQVRRILKSMSVTDIQKRSKVL